MKVSVVFLLALCSLSVGVNGWNCSPGPRLNNAYQIDAGLGSVVARDTNYYPYMLIGGVWRRITTSRFRHLTVGAGGVWGVATNYRVYKLIAGSLIATSGTNMRMVDAGGNEQLVGTTTSTLAYCLNSRAASTYTRGSLRWNYLSRRLKYYSCSPRNGCWGVDSKNRIYYTQTLYPLSCRSTGWRIISGALTSIEVGTDGTVFGVMRGQVFQRIGISTRYPYGTGWRQIPMCLKARHVTYDLGRLWVVGTTGSILQCTH